MAGERSSNPHSSQQENPVPRTFERDCVVADGDIVLDESIRAAEAAYWSQPDVQDRVDEFRRDAAEGRVVHTDHAELRRILLGS